MFCKEKYFKKFFCFFSFFSLSAEASFLELEWEHYSSKPITSEQLKDYVFLKGDFGYRFKKKPLAFESELLFENSLDFIQWSHWDIPQLFVSYTYNFKKTFYHIKSIEISLGRKLKTWSEGDKFWKLGLWNPLIFWNSLYPKEKGVVGSFFTFKSHRWKTDFFLGAIHLPDSLPHFRENNQKVYTYSRWGSILPRTVDYYNLDIYYIMTNSLLFDYLNQQSFYGSFSTWSEIEGSRYWIRWSLAYKPTNHFYYILNKKDRLIVNKKTEDRDPIYVAQEFTGLYGRQRTLSTEWGLDYKKLTMVFSLENASIKDEKVIDQETWSFLQSRESFTYFSVLSKYHYKEKSFFELAFIQSWFGNYNSYSKTDAFPAFLVQHRVSNGFSIGLEHKGLDFKQQLFEFHLKYQYSLLDQGAWFFIQSLYYLSPKIYTKVSAHILGSKKRNNPPKSFLENFYYNDYFTWSLVYDF